MEKNPDLNVTPRGCEALGPINYVEFNMRNPPFDDVRVRADFRDSIAQSRSPTTERQERTMAIPAQHAEPADAAARRAVEPVTVYTVDRLPPYDRAFYETVRSDMVQVGELTVPPRDARAFEVPAGHLFRIVNTDGPQVGDLNLWNAANLAERFYSGKTRALHATHVSTSDRLWSNFPWLRPMATITHDTLDWYGFDEFGGGVHDVIGTRCDPYTNHLLTGGDYHYCCHSNLTRALAAARDLPLGEAETHVHDVVNVFMCTGYTRGTNQYFMKASPARSGDFLELFAEIDLLAGLSACPGGDCGAGHSSDSAPCHPLRVEIFRPREEALASWRPAQASGYGGGHGVG